MISTTPPIKMGFIESFKYTGKTFSNAFKKFRQDLPLLLKKNIGLCSAPFIFSLSRIFIPYLPQRPDLIIYFSIFFLISFLFYFSTLLMINIRMIQANFSNDGYVTTGWGGIKWGMLETKLVGFYLLMAIFIILVGGIIAGFLGLLGLLPSSKYYFLIILSVGGITGFYIALRFAFLPILLVAKMKNLRKESLNLTKNNKIFIVWIFLVNFVVQMPFFLVFFLLENLLKDSFISLSQTLRMLVTGIQLLSLIFSTQLSFEIFNRIASPDLKKRLSEAFLAKKP